MSEFKSYVQETSAAPSVGWLEGFQREAKSRWDTVTFPTRKTEHWKYTNLSVFNRTNFFSSVPAEVVPNAEVLAHAKIEGLASFDLVFVNGFFNEGLSSDLADVEEGVSIFRIADANEAQQQAVLNALGSIAKDPKHVFSTLNEAQLSDGVVVDVAKNVVSKTPIRILNVTCDQTAPAHSAQRLFVSLKEGANATVVEHFVGDETSENLLANQLTEIALGKNAKLSHYRINAEHESAIHVGGVHSSLDRDATLNSFYMSFGSQLKRIDVVVNHNGEGAHCEMNGVYVPRNNQHVDYHTCIEHAVPHCTTNEVFRGIISDQAKAVFNGRIHIHKDAQKTLAQLSNKNLLTSNKAEVNTKPELEIYADDVQCAHGATVAQLDTTSLHYLKTRGISEAEALVMLSFGFINELVNEIALEPLQNYLRPRLSRLFSRDPELLKHIFDES